jgi:VWFA-related protein
MRMRRYSLLQGWRALFCAIAFAGAAASVCGAQQQNTGQEPTLRLTSTLVFLDVTVLDKNGRPVTTGLTKDDFSIAEDGKTRPIFSFEAPEEHVAAGDDEENPAGKAPVTILVLDQLNTSVEEFTPMQKAAHDWLASQPAQLAGPAEVLVQGNTSLEMVQGFTRSRDDLLFAVDHVPPVNAFKQAKSDFDGERARQSMEALVQIAMQNRGIPGRKNILWLGRGGPSLSRAAFGPMLDEWSQYVHATANLLVEARVSLFVVFPQMKVISTNGSITQVDRDANYGNNGPFTGDVNFALFAKETGGALFYNRNDLSNEVHESAELGANYYTLTFRPGSNMDDGKFRHVLVKVRNKDLRVVTKIGYFALPKKAPDANQQTALDLTVAAQSTIAMNGVEMTVSDVVRNPEARTAQFILHMKPKHLGWTADSHGTKTANLTVGLMSLSGSNKVLASRYETVSLHSTAADPDQLQEEVRMRLTARIPPRTQEVRIVLKTTENSRMAAATLDKKMLEAAPVTAESKPAGQAAKVGQEN